ncbi:hypothetical protein HK096_002890, partial [Nowakowskiella sp. JEL0078]
MEPKSKREKANLFKVLSSREIGTIANRNYSYRKLLNYHPALISRLTLSRVLRSHTGCVNTLDWSENGNYLASGSDDARICIWRFCNSVRSDSTISPDPYLLTSIKTGHLSNIFDCKFMPSTDSRVVVSCSLDKTIRICNLDYDLSHGSLSTVYRCHDDSVKRICTIPNDPFKIFTGFVYYLPSIGTVRQHDRRVPHSCLRTQQCSKPLIDYSKSYIELTAMSINHFNFNIVAVAGSNPNVFLHDRRMPQHPFRKLQPNVSRVRNRSITSVKFSKFNSSELIASYSSSFVYLYDLKGSLRSSASLNHFEGKFSSGSFFFTISALYKGAKYNEVKLELWKLYGRISGGEIVHRNLARCDIQLASKCMQSSKELNDPNQRKIYDDQCTLHLQTALRHMDQVIVVKNCLWNTILKAFIFYGLALLEISPERSALFHNSLTTLELASSEDIPDINYNDQGDITSPLSCLKRLKSLVSNSLINNQENGFENWCLFAKEELGELESNSIEDQKSIVIDENELNSSDDSAWEDVDNDAIFSDTSGSEPDCVYVGHSNIQTVKEVTFIGDNDQYVASGSDDGCVYIYDKYTQKLRNILHADCDVVNVIVGHPYTTALGVSGIDSTIKIFESIYPENPWKNLDENQTSFDANTSRSSSRQTPRRWHDAGPEIRIFSKSEKKRFLEEGIDVVKLLGLENLGLPHQHNSLENDQSDEAESPDEDERKRRKLEPQRQNNRFRESFRVPDMGLSSDIVISSLDIPFTPRSVSISPENSSGKNLPKSSSLISQVLQLTSDNEIRRTNQRLDEITTSLLD